MGNKESAVEDLVKKTKATAGNLPRYLLDCTLRDGGYVNDWHFGQDNIANIYGRLLSSGVDVIEVGFLDARRTFDPGRTIMPDTEAVDRIFGRWEHPHTMTAAMIDYGTCGIEHIRPCRDCWLDGIRVIFKKNRMHEALDFCGELKSLGYKVFVQAVSITSYSPDDLCELIGLINACQPYAMSIVDTYGLLDEEWLSHILTDIDRELSPKVILGYHAHNNFQLGYANAVSVLKRRLTRPILVDGTLYGMGKSAGNAPLELIAMYMNQCLGACYDVSQMQEAISTSILDIYRKHPWGYTLFYFIAASNQCHPDYVSYLMNKRTLSVTAVNEILQKLPQEKRLGKDMQLIERLYLAYQKRECSDGEAVHCLEDRLNGRTILLVGPGKSIELQKEAVLRYIAEADPVIISINYIPRDICPQYLFLTNSRRYLQMASKLTEPAYNSVPIIATSNITCSGSGFAYTVNYSALIDEQADIPDNSMIMLLRLLERINVSGISLAGLDGYTPDDVNYFDINMEYSFVKEKADMLNRYVRSFLASYPKDVNFITRSRYQQTEERP